MAERARLIPVPVEAPKVWPWHHLKWGSVSVSETAFGDRRMEAESFLSSGYGVRKSIERQRDWTTFGSLARPWAPPRIKQIFVDPQHGVPYLNTSQVFEIRPKARKFLAAGKTSKAESRLSVRGTILVMASASPGRTTIVTKAHENAFLSHHFMRVDPVSADQAGWVYAFLVSPQGQAMMSGSQYASIIRHIEPHHLAALPVPNVSRKIALRFQHSLDRILELRNTAFSKAEAADLIFADAIGPVTPQENQEGFEVRSSALTGGRRRFEAEYHSPKAAAILKRFKRFDRLSEVTERIWWMPRFKRFYGEGGIPYLSADELFSISPQGLKKILVNPGDDHSDYFVEPNWIVMACSGQIYGTNGAATLLTAHHKNAFFSHDLIRIVANRSLIRPGYLVTALTHRTHGRPLLIREAYGTSIPHLDPGDVSGFPVVRLPPALETEIAELAEASAVARFEADALERKLAEDAGVVIDQFIAGTELK